MAFSRTTYRSIVVIGAGVAAASLLWLVARMAGIDLVVGRGSDQDSVSIGGVLIASAAAELGAWIVRASPS